MWLNKLFKVALNQTEGKKVEWSKNPYPLFRILHDTNRTDNALLDVLGRLKLL